MSQHEEEYYRFQTHARGLLDAVSLRQRFERLAGWYAYRLGKYIPQDVSAACLDVPCGYGNFLYFLRSKGYENISGYDLDRGQIELARLLDLPVRKGDVFKIMADEKFSYNLISSLDFVEHLEKDDALKFLGLCLERLQPGGCLILRTPCADGPFGSHDVWNDLTHKWGMTSSLLRAMLEMKGYERIELLDERPQPSSFIEWVRWLVFFPAKFTANLITILLGMSPPAIWSRSMIAVAYKPGGEKAHGATKRPAAHAKTGSNKQGMTTTQSATATRGSAKRWLRNWMMAFLWPRPFVGIAHLPWFFSQYRQYKRSNPQEVVNGSDMHPCLLDKSRATPFDPHYFYQGAWLARQLRADGAGLHVDLGSSVMMISVLSGYVKTVSVDYRPLHAELAGLASVGANMTSLPFGDASVASLSSLHVIEHIGLGRYGDPLDAGGSRKAAQELVRILKPGGCLYLSAPVGRERVCFNAHRVFDPLGLVEMVSGLGLLSFSFVDDAGKLHADCSPEQALGNEYACGMYVFEKPKGESG